LYDWNPRHFHLLLAVLLLAIGYWLLAPGTTTNCVFQLPTNEEGGLQARAPAAALLAAAAAALCIAHRRRPEGPF
jgi:hypothetical protein